MNTRVTQNDIARVAGVHNTTVSLALRNSPAIPEATRKRIQAIADELGYFPDPALQALVAYRNGRNPSRRQETLAFLTNWPTKWGWQDDPAQARAYAGAQRRAAACGFQFEHFWLSEPGMTQRRLNSVLFHRGITGVIVAAQTLEGEPLAELDWTRLSGVRIGCFPRFPAIHRVIEDHAGGVRRAVRQALAAGAERIGLVLPAWRDELADQAWSSAFLAEQCRLESDQRVPVLLYGDRSDVGGADGPIPELEHWLERHQPDVVLGAGSAVRDQLETLRVRVPRDVAWVDLALESADGRCAGVRENGERVGEIAVEILVHAMQQNFRGVPAVPTITALEGAWVDGETLPASKPACVWSRASRRRAIDEDRMVACAP